MASSFARRWRLVCALSAVALAVLVAPGVAAANTNPAECQGAQTGEGAGSTLQKLAQVSVWEPGFNVAANELSCTGAGEEPKTTYKSIGSGQGMEEWGLNAHAFNTNVIFVATDEPPNAAQKAVLEAANLKAKTKKKNKVLETLPVLQGSVAIIIHLPAGCEAESTPAPHRLAIGDKALEGIYRGTVRTWGEFLATAESVAAGNKITPSSCESETIIPIVRSDGSGTTHIFKKYLSLINPAGTFETENLVFKTWNEISEGVENTVWPNHVVTRETGSGGGALVTTVATTPSSVGYANLADARGNAAFTPAGKTPQTFWGVVENKVATTEHGKLIPATYADPSTDKETSNTPEQANCESTEYTNSKKKFPPKKAKEPWNAVTTSLHEKNYSICGLTYDLVYKSYGGHGMTAGQATTAKRYMLFELGVGAISAPDGQELITTKRDYLKLTTQLDTIAKKGAMEVGP